MKVKIAIEKFGMNVPNGCIQMYYAIRYAKGNVKTVGITYFPSLPNGDNIDKYECNVTSGAMLILKDTFLKAR